MKNDLLHFINQQYSLKDIGFSISGSNSFRTLLSTTFAIFSYELVGELPYLSDKMKQAWVNLLLSSQDPRTGLFFDPIASSDEFPKTGHNWEYFTLQNTFFCVSALDALRTTPLHRLEFVKHFVETDEIIEWLVQLDWSNPWLESNKIMFWLSFLIHSGCIQNAHLILDWLAQRQDPVTGFWGTQEGASLLNAMAGAFHFYYFYFYLGRPVQYLDKIIDHTLILQQSDGLYHPKGGGEACLDLDAVDILVKCSMLTDYRAEDVKRSLSRTYEAILRNQRPNGAFCEAIRPQKKKSIRRRIGEAFKLDKLLNRPYKPEFYVVKYCDWDKMAYYADEGDLWSCWFRPLVLGLISTRYTGEFDNNNQWTFRRSPALGWHDPKKIMLVK